MNDRPAVLGNDPLFGERLPIIQPTLPTYQSLAAQIEEIVNTGMLTKGKYLRQFEERLADHLGVRHVVCVSSCTMGLALTYHGLGLTGEVRAVGQTESRIRESAKMGFERCVLPRVNLERIKMPKHIELIGVGSVEEAQKALF